MFSIIIPCYNDKKLLRRTLQSFIWQASSIKFEIILIDNNSMDDNIDDLYSEYFSRLPIYLLKQPRLRHTYALSKARNLGLAIASYPWIICLDSDTLINPDYLLVASNMIEQGVANPIITGCREFIDVSNIAEDEFSFQVIKNTPRIASESNYHLKKDRRISYLQNIQQAEHPWAYIHGGNCLFNKQQALAIGGFDESYDGCWGYEDIDFAYRLITKTKAVPIYAENLTVYHQEKNYSCSYQEQRFDKLNNPNWQRICQAIKGFKQQKEKEYQLINKKIIT